MTFLEKCDKYDNTSHLVRIVNYIVNLIYVDLILNKLKFKQYTKLYFLNIILFSVFL